MQELNFNLFNEVIFLLSTHKTLPPTPPKQANTEIYNKSLDRDSTKFFCQLTITCFFFQKHSLVYMSFIIVAI